VPVVFLLNGDQEEKPRVNVLPGGDAHEIVVFRDLEKKNWAELHARIHRGFSDVADACNRRRLMEITMIGAARSEYTSVERFCSLASDVWGVS
jgi:hypothetical protein